jgi:ubiquinone/menaquinone biosynthesis C-methylase UbiE
MTTGINCRTCPVGLAGGLDNSIRRFLQNPEKILKPFISKGMTVLDLGCGPGFFSLEIAKLLQNSGKVIAADLQEGMLEIVRRKIAGLELEQRIELHKCADTKIGISEQVDFILAFYMIHEVQNQDVFFEELKSMLKPGGKIYIIEPWFHVTRNAFEVMVGKVKNIGLEIIERPKVLFSRAVLFALVS